MGDDMIDLASEYATATEWNLATLEEMALIKGTSASRIRRQRGICERMLILCLSFEDVDWTKRGRSSRAFAAMRSGYTASFALDKEIATMREGWTT